jgi:hypothetical protein
MHNDESSSAGISHRLVAGRFVLDSLSNPSLASSDRSRIASRIGASRPRSSALGRGIPFFPMLLDPAVTRISGDRWLNSYKSVFIL